VFRLPPIVRSLPGCGEGIHPSGGFLHGPGGCHSVADASRSCSVATMSCGGGDLRRTDGLRAFQCCWRGVPPLTLPLVALTRPLVAARQSHGFGGAVAPRGTRRLVSVPASVPPRGSGIASIPRDVALQIEVQRPE